MGTVIFYFRFLMNMVAINLTRVRKETNVDAENDRVYLRFALGALAMFRMSIAEGFGARGILLARGT